MGIRNITPGDSAEIMRCVLEYPFLQWTFLSNSLPQLIVNSSAAAIRLEIEAVLGRGGFGVVFRASMDGKELSAVKIPIPRVSSTSPNGIVTTVITLLQSGDHRKADEIFNEELTKRREALAAAIVTGTARKMLDRFSRESRVLQRLRHHHIVRLQFSGTISCRVSDQSQIDLPCVAMELVSGITLKDALLDPQYAWITEIEAILRIGRDMSRALAALHDMGVCHRDFSWNNVLIRSDGTSMLIDLGNVNDPDGDLKTMAELLSPSGTELPVPLTPGFVSPEHWNFWQPEAEADQFAMGVLTYLLGSKGQAWPFARHPLGQFVTNNVNDRNAPLPLEEHLQSQMKLLGWPAVKKTAVRRLSAILQRMLLKDKHQRYPSMRDVAAELHSLMIDIGEESWNPFDTAELIPDGHFVELCRQVNFKKPDAKHGALFLALMVSQIRLQISKFITFLWETLNDTFHGTIPQSPVNSLQKATEQIVEMIKHLNLSLQAVTQPFGSRPDGGMLKPRFGGRLRNLNLRASNALKQLAEFSRSAGLRIRQSHFSAGEDLEKERQSLWVNVSKTLEELADCDFELALYTSRLRIVLKDLPKSQ